MQIEPWHVAFSIVGGLDVQFRRIEENKAVLTMPDHQPVMVNLLNGDCIHVEQTWDGRYAEMISNGRVFG